MQDRSARGAGGSDSAKVLLKLAETYFADADISGDEKNDTWGKIVAIAQENSVSPGDDEAADRARKLALEEANW